MVDDEGADKGEGGDGAEEAALGSSGGASKFEMSSPS